MFSLLAAAAALAQPVTAVPVGATSVSVLLCPRPERCGDEMRTLGEHYATLGLPLLDFRAVAGAALGGADALAAFDPGAPDAAARLDALPHTVAPDVLLATFLRAADRALSDGDAALADQLLARAASSSGGQAYDLPAVSSGLLARYLAQLERRGEPARLHLSADVVSAVFYVDGVQVGRPPGTVAVDPGWHRVTAERPGRRTAWVASVEVLPGGSASLAASLAPDDGEGGLRAAVLGELNGVAAPPDVAEALSAWGRANGLRWIRFVEVVPADPTVEEVLGPELGLRAVYLDVPARRFTPRGPGPAALRVAADRERLRLGVALGWLHLGSREHVVFEVLTSARLTPLLAIDARVALAHTATAYNLYPTWVDHQVYPVSAGARLGRPQGPYAAASALVVVPYAVGGELRLGWDLVPGPTQRIALEARAGWTDQGAVLGAGFVLSRRH